MLLARLRSGLLRFTTAAVQVVNNVFSSNRRGTLFVYASLILIIAVGAYNYYSLAQFFEENELAKGYPHTRKGYISDEVWYVSASRNILRKIFGLVPCMDPPRATIVFTTDTDANNAWLRASSYGIKVIGGRNVFSKIKALYVEAQSPDLIESFARRFNATDVVYGWVLADEENVHEYLNLEHPPTAKYIVALLMYTIGDEPMVWRIPSIAMGALVIALVFLLVYEVTKLPELGLLAAIAVALDPMTRVMSSIALLDIYATAFTVLTLYLAVKGRPYCATFVLGFASTFKFTALMATIPLLFIYANRLFKRGLRAHEVVAEVLRYLLLAMLLFAFFQTVLSIPIILRIGFSSWVRQSIFVPLSWHLSVKCDPKVNPRCPIPSAPWEWFFGINSFPLYLSPNIYAQGFTPAYTIAFVLMLFSIPLMTKDVRSRTLWYMLFGTFLGYLAIWLLGGRTQYSFYAVQLTPLVYAYLLTQIYDYLDRENVIATLSLWRKAFLAFANAILSLVR